MGACHRAGVFLIIFFLSIDAFVVRKVNVVAVFGNLLSCRRDLLLRLTGRLLLLLGDEAREGAIGCGAIALRCMRFFISFSVGILLLLFRVVSRSVILCHNTQTECIFQF